jgi:hypothetical protein
MFRDRRVHPELKNVREQAFVHESRKPSMMCVTMLSDERWLNLLC